MFRSSHAFSGFSVDDLDAAADFYSGTLGLQVARDDEMMGMLNIKLGSGADVMAYSKANHVPATFTILNFIVSDIEAAVDGLTAAGVQMLRYEGFGQDEKGIGRGAGPPIAWFTDPAGNILAVIEDESAG